MDELTIYTYGSGAFIAQVLEAVKEFTSGGIALSMFKIFLIVALLYGLSTVGLRVLRPELAVADARDTSMAPFVLLLRNIFIAAIGTWFFFNPIATRTVIVEDRFDPTQSRVVDRVPLGIAFTGYLTSVVGDRIGETVETWLTPVEALRSRLGGGVGIGPKYLNQLFDLIPPGAPSEYGGTGDVSIRGVLEAWISQCIYPNFAVIDGEGARAQGLREFATSDFILMSPVLNSPPFSDPNTPLSVQFYKTGPERTTCRNAPNQILTKWLAAGVMEPWIARFSASVFGVRESSPELISRVYDIVDHYFPSSALGTHDKLIQIATINTAYAAYMKLLSEYSAAGAFDIARRRQAAGWVEAAKVGARILPVIRQISEAAIYLFGAFLPVFVAACGLSALFKYVRFVFWLGLWIPVFAILNAVADYHMMRAIESVSQCVGGTCELVLNFETVDRLRTESSTILGYIGLLSLSAPGIAWGIIRGADALGGMVGSVLSTGEAASVGASSVVERTGALTRYSAGTMVQSAHGAGIGQVRMAGEIEGVRDYGNLGALQTSAALQMGEVLKFRLPLLEGLVSTAGAVDPNLLRQAGSRDVYSRVGEGAAFFEVAHRALNILSGGKTDFVDTARAIASGMSVKPLIGDGGRVEGAIIGLPNTNVLVPFGESSPVVTWSGLPVAGSVSQAFAYSYAAQAASQSRDIISYTKEKARDLFYGKTEGLSESTQEALRRSYAENLEKEIQRSEELRGSDTVRELLNRYSRIEGDAGFDFSVGRLVNRLVKKDATEKSRRSGIMLEAGINYQAGRMGATESAVSGEHGLRLSDSEREALRRAHEKALENAARYVLSTESGFRDLSRLAQSERAEVAKTFDEAYRKGEEIARRFSEDVTSGLVNQYMERKYGDLPGLEKILRTTQDLKSMEAKGDYSEFWSVLGIKPGDLSGLASLVEQQIARGKVGVDETVSKLQRETGKIGDVPSKVRVPRHLTERAPVERPEELAEQDFEEKRKVLQKALDQFNKWKEENEGLKGLWKNVTGVFTTPTLKLDLSKTKILREKEE